MTVKPKFRLIIRPNHERVKLFGVKALEGVTGIRKEILQEMVKLPAFVLCTAEGNSFREMILTDDEVKEVLAALAERGMDVTVMDARKNVYSYGKTVIWADHFDTFKYATIPAHYL